MDAYKQSQYHLDILTDLETWMSWVYRRTGTAMAITSATTCSMCRLLVYLDYSIVFNSVIRNIRRMCDLD
eukprot:scaffold6573_cov72-Skeletonema_marinoi.AAC.1